MSVLARGLTMIAERRATSFAGDPGDTCWPRIQVVGGGKIGRILATGALAGLLALGSPAVAGVADPLPDLGMRMFHVFTIPGVVSNASLGTTIVCTSLEQKADVFVLVEFFPSAGGDFSASSFFRLAPGGSEATSTTGTTLSETILSLPDDDAPRSARVGASSKKITCSATVLASGTNGSLPGVAWSLPVIHKTKQKGD